MQDITYIGEPVSDSVTFKQLPYELQSFLLQTNGLVAYLGGLHIRGCCLEPTWHSLREAWTGDTAFCFPAAVLTRPATVDVARLVDIANVHPGSLVRDARAPAGVRLDWDGIPLDVATVHAATGEGRVWWSVPEDAVILHRVDRPSRGERENPVQGVISRYLPLGAEVSLAIEVGDDPSRTLRTAVSSHVAERNALCAGRRVTVSLLASDIHIMPWDEKTLSAGRAS